MLDAEIRETIVVPDANGGTVIRLQISDAPLPSESAAIVLQMSVRLPPYEPPLTLAHYQREAMRVAYEVLRRISEDKLKEIRANPHLDATPTPLKQ